MKYVGSFVELLYEEEILKNLTLSSSLTGFYVRVLCSDHIGTSTFSTLVTLANLGPMIIGEVADDGFIRGAYIGQRILALESVGRICSDISCCSHGAHCFRKVIAPVSSTRRTSTRTEFVIAANHIVKIS